MRQRPGSCDTAHLATEQDIKDPLRGLHLRPQHGRVEAVSLRRAERQRKAYYADLEEAVARRGSVTGSQPIVARRPLGQRLTVKGHLQPRLTEERIALSSSDRSSTASPC